jgi:hypothetical protein
VLIFGLIFSFCVFFLVNGEKLWQGLNREDYDVVSQWIDYYKNHSGKNYLVQKKYEYTENPTIQGMWHPFVNVEPEIATAKFPVVMLNITSFYSISPICTNALFIEINSKVTLYALCREN